jgi:hypothetical protein
MGKGFSPYFYREKADEGNEGECPRFSERRALIYVDKMIGKSHIRKS